MNRGEELKVLVDYDLFGHNCNEEIGVYLKTDKKTGKHLMYFPQFKEWGEIPADAVARVRPSGFVLKVHREFVSLVSEMKITFPT